MITDKDIQKLMVAFKTRQESDKDIEDLKDHFDIKFDGVMTRMDQVYTEVLKVREEQAGHAQRHEDIEKDLSMIKRLPVIAHQLKKK